MTRIHYSLNWTSLTAQTKISSNTKKTSLFSFLGQNLKYQNLIIPKITPAMLYLTSLCLISRFNYLVNKIVEMMIIV